MGLRSYIIKRGIYSFILIFFVITINFIIFMAMPADPVSIIAGGLRLRPEQRDALIELYGLREPMWVRYTKYVRNLFLWDFGFSYYSLRPVSNEIMERIPNTLLLMGVSTLLSIIIGTLVGVLAAYKRGKIFDLLTVSGSLATYSLPTFWIGMMFLLIFGKWLGIFPIAGTMSRPPPIEPFAKVLDILWHMFLPVLTIILFTYGHFVLLMRSAILENLTEDYITMAKAKGLDDKTILLKHALRNALLPLITQSAIYIGLVMSGAIITETVFTWRGLGTYIWEAIIVQDYPRLQATFYIISLCVIIANFIADITYGFVDPRIKYD